MRRKTVYRRWTAWELEYLRNEYPNRPNAELAEWLHRPPRAIQLKALKLGVQKSPEYMANSGFKRNQFKPGHAPFNKGRERRFWASDESQQRMAKGQFKPGQVRDDNPNGRKNKPIGHEKVYADGYVWIITEHGRKQKHRVGNGKGARHEYHARRYAENKDAIKVRNIERQLGRSISEPSKPKPKPKPVKPERLCEKCPNWPCFDGIENLETDFARLGCHGFPKQGEAS